MSRFKTAMLILMLTAATAVPPARASIEVDEEEVIFRMKDTGASKVSLAGDFNNWNPTMDTMVRRGDFWEVRLYLVPGRYRYAFVVDGEYIPDPDNPNRDDKGDTYFIFLEEEGRYGIVYQVEAPGERKIEEIYDPYGALTAWGQEEYGLFTASAGVKGEIDGSARGNILVGAEYETFADDPVKAYLVRAGAEWAGERFRIGAFHRSGRVGFDDPLSLFTDVGPYAYPLDLFCRGAEVSAGWKGSVEGRAFFAGRIDGYSSGLERSGFHSPFEGNPLDRDMIGASLRGRLMPFVLEYLYRHDRGPDLNLWEGDSTVTSGYESRVSHGLLLELDKAGWPGVKMEYLTGRTRLHPRHVYSYPYEYWKPGGMENLEKVEGVDIGWEEGYRALAALEWSRGGLSGTLDWNRTTIKRDASFQDDEYWEEAVMDVLGAGVEYSADRISAALKADCVDFSGSGGMGRSFWLQRNSFWLDGDMLRTELLQFLDSGRLWRIRLEVEEKGSEEIPGPFRLEGYLEARGNYDDETSRGVLDVSAGKGVMLGRYLSVHADARYVSYSDDRWIGDSSFLDLWAGVRGNLGGSGWAALGIGVAPHRFDRWYFDFTGDGRESYLLDRHLFGIVGAYSEDNLIELLGEAEEMLSEEWSLTFEAGWSF